MKVLMHYEDHENSDYHKSLKITLPKSWKTGPTSKLLGQFVETYMGNETFKEGNPLEESQLHLSIRSTSSSTSTTTELVDLASDAVVLDVIPDRADLYVVHGPSQTLSDQKEAAQKAKLEADTDKNLAACTHFGCKQRFPPGGPYPKCQYHSAPPVFHETAKFWSCCPNKKAYDWDDFQNIPGCQTGVCTDIKEDTEQKQFLGGTDLRQAAGEAIKLKSIDDFNKAQAAGGADAAPVLDRLNAVLVELGIEQELYQQVVDGMRKKAAATADTEADVLEAVKKEMGSKFKDALKTVAAEQLRIS
ncbi:and histidine-rich domain-containing protein [Seminavis robusta]|uniref:And histidine-rich domain-containing protein n=1 Tax=Seminavis robusta TaxID=568900 RepID=A0A9N8EAG8_9STRA|nr:and histidine-rich domain-containing protein [Seminavis robusta]|eukprot:Sro808_g205480.1 and histidine-rich domain-containing protein (303) ;mRNA; f:38877-39785